MWIYTVRLSSATIEDVIYENKPGTVSGIDNFFIQIYKTS